MNENKRNNFDLNESEKEVLTIASRLNRPVKKTELVGFLTKTFQSGTAKQIRFVIDNCIENGDLCEDGGYVYCKHLQPELPANPTAYDTALIKYLPVFYEEAKAFYEEDNLKVSAIFDYICHAHSGLLKASNPAYDFMEWMTCNLPEHCLSNQFFAEMNDYDFYQGWFQAYFNRPDCRVKMKNIAYRQNTISIGLYLIPGKKGSFQKAHQQYLEFKEHISQYFDVKNIRIHTALMKIYKTNTKYEKGDKIDER